MDPNVPKPLKKSYLGIIVLVILAAFIVAGYYLPDYRALMWIGLVLIGLWLLTKVLKLVSDFMP